MNERITKNLGLDKNGCRVYIERGNPSKQSVKVCPHPSSWIAWMRWKTGMKVREGTKWTIFESDCPQEGVPKAHPFEENFDKRVPYSFYPVAHHLSEDELYEYIDIHYS
jgi:hypothetical protein